MGICSSFTNFTTESKSEDHFLKKNKKITKTLFYEENIEKKEEIKFHYNKTSKPIFSKKNKILSMNDFNLLKVTNIL